MKFEIREVANGFIVTATKTFLGYDTDNDSEEFFIGTFSKALEWIARYGRKELDKRENERKNRHG